MVVVVIGVVAVECTREVGWRMTRVVSIMDNQDRNSVLLGEDEEEEDCKCSHQCMFF